MARKKHGGGHANHERWLVSYADFITLLFAFFVVMFASSQTDKGKVAAVSAAVKDALEKGGVAATVHEVLGGTVDDAGKGNAQMKGPGGSQAKTDPAPPAPVIKELSPTLKYLTAILETEIKDGKIEIKQEPRGLVVSLKQAAFFPSGDDGLDPKTLDVIDKIGKKIRDESSPIRLEGHTDAVPIHTARFRSNWELSAARAIAMLEIFSSRCGVPRDHMAIAGYADTIPVAPNDTEEGRARNRRVDIVILSQLIRSDGSSSVEPVKNASGGEGKAPQKNAPASHEKKK